MRRTLNAAKLATAVALAAGLMVLLVKGPEAANQNAPSGDQFTPLIHSLTGRDLFRAYCASCHGSDGKGAGPVSPALKAKLPDLTLLATKNHGEFPAGRVRQMITGNLVLISHGSREMPVWGPIFHQVEEDVDRGNVRLQNLVDYLGSIQEITPARPSSGASLYQQNCAACHGDDLKGNQSAPPPFGNVPDLTTLATRHGGAFPDAYVAKVLRNGVKISAHGPAEMPVWGEDFRIGQGLTSAQVEQCISELTNYLKSAQQR